MLMWESPKVQWRVEGGGGEEGEQADEEEVGEEEHGREEHCYLKELSPVLVERHIGSRCENVERESKKGGHYSVAADKALHCVGADKERDDDKD